MIPLPPAFADRIRTQLGDEAGAFFAALDAPYAAALRLNPRRDGAEAACAAYTGDPVPWCPAGRYVRPGARPGLSPLQDAGAFYIQEASAMAPAMLLNARPGERVLDLCAAPGGKSGILADGMAGQGLLVCNEPEPGRARILSATMERLGVTHAAVTNAWPEALATVFPAFFDAILVDAPCSGEGMFRREMQSRSEWTPAGPAGCAARQAGILDRAADMLKPGGRLVYSTCTFSRAENEDAVGAFLARHPDFQPAVFTLDGVGDSEDGCVRLWPHRVRGDGQFAALLLKGGAPQGEAGGRPRRSGRAPARAPSDAALRRALEPLEDIVPYRPLIDGRRLIQRGDVIFALPEGWPEDAPAVRPGLALGRAGRGYVEPDHALAMAITPDRAARSRALSEAEARAILRGETLPDPGRGWTLLTYMNMPLGWGKASGGLMKNHIPKGLRHDTAP